MSASSAIAVCPKCGRDLALDAPLGLCVKCLFGAMLDAGPLDQASRPSSDKATLPRAFGAYELLEELARGGMGIVYRARQTPVNRQLLHGVHSVAFSPDSQRLAAGSDDRQAVKISDTQTLQELLTLRGESTFFSQTRFSPDGNLLASMSFRGVLHVWRAPSWADIEAAESNEAQGSLVP